MEILLLIGGIVLFVFVLNLRGRVHALEGLLKSGQSKSAAAPGAPLQPQSETQPLQALPQTPANPLLTFITQQRAIGTSREEIKNALLLNHWKEVDIENAFASLASLPIAQSMPTEKPPAASHGFVEWIKEDWLMKLGALLILIGFGWLTSYAFLHNWIGPMGRIGLGMFGGTLFLLLGWWRMKKYIHQGGIFLVLGSTTILLTLFAAREIYDFFTPASVLAVMFLSTAFVALASVKYQSRSLALASLILAGIAPMMTNSPTNDDVALFTYLFVVVLGAIWVVAVSGMRELTTAALLLVAFYSLSFHLSYSTSAERDTLLLFAYAFAAVFFVTNTLGILKLKDRTIVPDLITACGNGLFLLAWIMFAAPEEWKSSLISAWMIAFMVGAFVIFKMTARHEPFYVYAGIGVAMLAAATSVELSGASLTIAYTIESGIAALVAYLLLQNIKIAERVSLLLIGPAILSGGSIASREWALGMFNKDFFVLLILGLTMLALGLFFMRRVHEVADTEPKTLSATLLVIGSLYMYGLLWLSLHAELENENIAVMISLVTYTVIGLTAYFYGLTNNKKGLQWYGGALIGFVVVRLLMIDVWKMELTGRIFTFFMVGALLVGTAFLGKKKKIPPLVTDETLAPR